MKSFSQFLETKKMKGEDPCWKDYEMVGHKMKDGKKVPNCVPKKESVEEKKLTPAELKKREEIAKAIEKDNPDMPMDVKMAIATSTAKRVAEGFEPLEEAEYQGKKVTLNKPFYTPDGPKKSAVYVKNKKGNVIKVTFGDPNMEIKRDNPERRKSFRARHNCDQKKDPTTPGYWSCRAW